MRWESHKREGDFVVTAGEKLEAFIFLYRRQALPHKRRLFQNEDCAGSVCVRKFDWSLNLGNFEVLQLRVSWY